MHEACSHTKSFTLWCSNTHGRWLLNILSMFFKIIEILSYGSKWFHNSHMKINFIIWWLYSTCLSIGQQLFWAFGIRLIMLHNLLLNLALRYAIHGGGSVHHWSIIFMIQPRVFPILVNWVDTWNFPIWMFWFLGQVINAILFTLSRIIEGMVSF